MKLVDSVALPGMRPLPKLDPHTLAQLQRIRRAHNRRPWGTVFMPPSPGALRLFHERKSA